MSKKPLSKKTETLLSSLRRRHGVRELPTRFLIVCEDEKSAPHYFEAMKKHEGLSATSVVVDDSGGSTQPLQVVEKAVTVKKEAARRNSATVPFGEVWCVIDGDYGPKITAARQKATAHGIQLAVSTQCFEYWVLLHFEESAVGRHDCDAVVRELKRNHLPHYDKGGCDFSMIVPHAPEACKRAERIRTPGIQRGELPEDQNPCSEVYKLVNAILGLDA